MLANGFMGPMSVVVYNQLVVSEGVQVADSLWPSVEALLADLDAQAREQFEDILTISDEEMLESEEFSVICLTQTC